MELPQKILDFFEKERVGILSNVSASGYPQNSAMHFSYRKNPLEFYFSTKSSTRKVENLTISTKSSFALGFSEVDWITIQMDGELTIIKNDLDEIYKIHYAKNPEAEKYKDFPETRFLKFVPIHVKFSDYKFKPPVIQEFGTQIP